MRFKDLTKVKIPKKRIEVVDDVAVKKFYNRIMNMKSTPVITISQFYDILKTNMAVVGSVNVNLDDPSCTNGNIDGKTVRVVFDK